MADIEYVRTTTRNRVLALVRDYEAKGFKRDEAMIRAGKQINRSSAWVERILSRRESATVSALDWLRLEHIAAKIEASAARIDANTAWVLEQKREVREFLHSSNGGPRLDHGCSEECLSANFGIVR